MNYLLDINACIALIKGKPIPVRERFELAQTNGSRLFVPSTAIFELWYGVAKSERKTANAKVVETFLAGPVDSLQFDDEDAETAGSIRAELESIGKPTNAYDLLIAGQAVRRKLTLVTSNTSEFRRVKGLLWEDWAKSGVH